MPTKILNDIRIRNLDPSIAEAVNDLAEAEGRTVEAYLRELIKDAVRTRIRDFPTASEWDRAGFAEVLELQPARQYLARQNDQEFRITLMRAITGEQPEWSAGIEEARTSPADDQCKVWTRRADAQSRVLGNTAAMALRNAMRRVSELGGVDIPFRPRSGVRDVSPRFGAIIDALDTRIPYAEQDFPRDKMVIYRTGRFDIYLNEVDDKRGALMVYRSGEGWSITNGRADYFPLDSTAVDAIMQRLYQMKVLRIDRDDRP